MRNLSLITLVLFACNSKTAVNDAQCSTEEQDMFMACIQSGCSASYSQDLSGVDACDVSGGGSVISVEGGGECGFSATGSCYVVCSCPEGTSATIDLGGDVQAPGDEAVDSGNDQSSSGSPDLTDVYNKIAALENTVAAQAAQIDTLNSTVTSLQGQTTNQQSQIADQQSQITDQLATITSLQSQLYDSNNQIASLQSDLLSLTSTVDSMQSDIDELYGSIGLVVSEYTVDCNSNNIDSTNPDYWASWWGGAWVIGTTWVSGATTTYYQSNHDCVLVEGVTEGDMPIVQVYQDNQMMTSDFFDYPSQTSWANEWMIGIEDGGLKGTFGTWVGPGSQYRYDASMGIIYTSAYYENSTTTTTTREYHVTVIGTKSYSAPGVPDFLTR